MTQKPHVFIDHQIFTLDIDLEDYSRYEYTWDKPAFLDYLEGEHKIVDKKDKDLLRADLEEKYPKACEQWQDSAAEYLQVPMMNTLYYFPGSIEFKEADRYKTIGSTTLLYDTVLDQWAVGMTGGGMDLTPFLLATFIALGQGIPANIAMNATKGYDAHLNKETHLTNCNLLAEAMEKEAIRWEERAKRLANQ